MRDIAFGLARFKNRYPRTAGRTCCERARRGHKPPRRLFVGLTGEVRSAMMAAPVVLRNPPHERAAAATLRLARGLAFSCPFDRRHRAEGAGLSHRQCAPAGGTRARARRPSPPPPTRTL